MKSNFQIATRLIGLSLANFLGCLDLTIVNTALPSIKINMGLTTVELQWIMNVLLLSLSSFMVIAGKLSDIYGRKRLLYIGLIVFSLASIFASIPISYVHLLICRFAQGISIAILYTAPVALIPVIMPNHVGKGMGILFGVSGFGLSLGPTIGGFLTTMYGWHAIFLINPCIALIIMLMIIKVPESKESSKVSVDYIGSFLLVVTLSLLVITTVNTNNSSWLSYKTIVSYLVSILIGALFVFRENKIQNPIINFKLFINNRFVIGAVANIFLAFFYSVFLFVIPLHLHINFHFSSEKVGYLLLVPTIIVAILSPFSGAMCDTWGAKPVLISGYISFILSAIIQILFSSSTGTIFMIIPYIFFGIGWACILSPSIITAMLSVPKELGGVAIGSIGTLHNIGAVFGVVFASLLSYQGSMVLVLSTSIFAFFIILLWLNHKEHEQ